MTDVNFIADNEGKEKLEKFTQRFNLPNSQMHFQPKRIESIENGVVTVWGLEATSNMHIHFKIAEDLFRKNCEKYPEQTRFLWDDWNREQLQK